MSDRSFLPIILGSDENAYGTARLFVDAYGIKPLLICTRRLIPTYYSKLFTLRRIDGFDSGSVFPDALCKVLNEYKDKYDSIVVVPCSDYYSAMMSVFHERFDGLISNSFITPELLDTLDTKDKFYALCEKYGMDYPKTYVAGPDERISAIDKIPFGYPIVVKPENSNAYEYLHAEFEGKEKVFYFNDREAYLRMVMNMNRSDYKGKLIIQEFIEGGDEAMRVMNSYSDKDGKVRAMCLGQPILEEYAPKTLGNYAAIISRYDKDIYAKVKQFLEDIGYVGFSNIDMKFDRRNNRYVMFEINPRLGRSSFYIYSAGVNMMKVLTEDTVFGKRSECRYADKTALWSNVPRSVIKKYITDPDIRSEALKLIKEKKYSRTLDCPADNDIRRFIWIKRYYMGQSKNFSRYYFDKTKRTL